MISVVIADSNGTYETTLMDLIQMNVEMRPSEILFSIFLSELIFLHLRA